MLLSSFDSAVVDIPCIVSGIRNILLCFPLTYTMDLFAAALLVHNCTKAHLDFDPQLLSIIVYVCIKSLFTIETIQLKSVKVLKSWKIPAEKLSRYQGLNLGLQLPIMSLMHILLNTVALMQTWNQRLVALEGGWSYMSRKLVQVPNLSNMATRGCLPS